MIRSAQFDPCCSRAGPAGRACFGSYVDGHAALMGSWARAVPPQGRHLGANAQHLNPLSLSSLAICTKQMEGGGGVLHFVYQSITHRSTSLIIPRGLRVGAILDDSLHKLACVKRRTNSDGSISATRLKISCDSLVGTDLYLVAVIVLAS